LQITRSRGPSLSRFSCLIVTTLLKSTTQPR
jgi:hypothetical protein